MNESVTYKTAGVNIAAGNEIVQTIKPWVQDTYTPEVIGGLGHFAGLYDLSKLTNGYQRPIMAQSIDGVGTKTMVAKMADCFDYLGEDLLSACSNDLLVLGAKTLTLLDYIACDQLSPNTITRFMKGLTQACKKNSVALVGGETAEMPGTYQQGEHDLVGIATGVVEKNNIIDGQQIQPEDLILGFSSSGLHTNGYSLARKLFFDTANYTIHQYVDDLQESVADALLKPHQNYNPPIHHLLSAKLPIHGMVHITGGGMLENIPRVLPPNTTARIDKNSYNLPPLFHLLKTIGKLTETECYKTFNMGIGYIVVIPPDTLPSVQQALTLFPDYTYQIIGKIISGNKEVLFL